MLFLKLIFEILMSRTWSSGDYEDHCNGMVIWAKLVGTTMRHKLDRAFTLAMSLH